MRKNIKKMGVGLAAVVLLVAAGGSARNAVPRSRAEPAEEIDALMLEVAALDDLYALDLTRGQLKNLLKLAEGCGDKPRRRGPTRVSDGLRQTLLDLRDALILGDDERIADLREQLDEQIENTQPEFDDNYEVTDTARRQCVNALASLGVRQVVAYAADQGAILTDPREVIEDGLDDGRAMSQADWAKHRDAVANSVADLIAGPDAEKSAAIQGKVVALLERFHGKTLSAKELDAEVKSLVGSATAFDMLRNSLSCHLARLLSNPQAITAIQARLAGRAKSGNDA